MAVSAREAGKDCPMLADILVHRDWNHAPVRGSQPSQDQQRIVGRLVVDEQKFVRQAQAGQGVGQTRLKLGEASGIPEDRDDHADLWRHKLEYAAAIACR